MQTHRRRTSKSILLTPRVTANVPNYYTHARRMTVLVPESEPDNTYIYGYLLLGTTFTTFIILMYAMIGSNYAPITHVNWLDWVKKDEYYCLLIPITAIVWIYFIIWNWMGMKFFRHN
ncbi:unnamed protein product [Cunninghamella echinulata]